MSNGVRTIAFVKASACGNDFLLIDSSVALGSRIQELTRRLCDRHEGIGADGVEWMKPHPSADMEIRLINADGSEAEISGNGTRCVAAYLCAEQGKEKITILTGAGMKTCNLTARSDAEYEFEISMGVAEVQSERTVKLRRGEVKGFQVYLGNPHYVVFVPQFAEGWQAQAAEIQQSGQFPQGVNIEYVVVESERDVRARFFERGAGETQSSGTGSCASAVAAIQTGRASSPVRVHTAGGMQTVRWENGEIALRGKARLICRGEFFPN